MTYNYYIEGWTNGIFLQYNIGGKTKKEVETARMEWQERNKVANTAWVLYTFSGNENRKYSRREYKVIRRSGTKAFFEYWPN